MISKGHHLFRFIINGIIFLILILVLDQITGRVLKHYYFTSKSGENYSTTYSMDSTKAKIIVLGSSRASHHYIPELIEDSLGMSCYNTGRDGNFLLFNYAVFKSILKRYDPEIIILDINPNDLFVNNREKSYEGLATLLPYFEKKPEIRGIVKLRSNFEQFKLLLHTYPYNSSLLAIANGNLGSEMNNRNKGYLPLNGSVVLKDKPSDKPEIPGEFDILKVNVIDSMALICFKRNIRFIVVQSPRYAIFNKSRLDLMLSTLSYKNGGEYWNLVNDTTFLNSPELFNDGAHLNHNGAQLFTRLIIQKLKQ